MRHRSVQLPSPKKELSLEEPRNQRIQKTKTNLVVHVDAVYIIINNPLRHVVGSLHWIRTSCCGGIRSSERRDQKFDPCRLVGFLQLGARVLVKFRPYICLIRWTSRKQERQDTASHVRMGLI